MQGYMDGEENIAVIGMACRFPGAANYEEFWNNLLKEKSFSSELPKERGDWKKLVGLKRKEQKNVDVVKWGNYLQDIDAFDAQFFGMSDREADTMDPQQRLLLELSWNCFEDACIRPSDMMGKKVGVFISEFSCDFKELISQDLYALQPHHLSGSSSCVLANRLSYYYNFIGPSMVIDTACSGSLTALHIACESLRSGESEIALVAGANLLLSPAAFITFTQMRMLSPSGSCKTFDDSADGYVRGEGVGVLLIKPLEAALRDGDVIHGIVKGSAINHGGKVRSITRPNEHAQADLIVEAVEHAGVEPDSITYIEAHGTGTPKGDPIEFNGLKEAFSRIYEQDTAHDHSKSRCGLGSAKSSIGHLEAVAGIAGIVKVLLSMKYKKLPKLTRFEKLNHRISLEETPFYIVDQNEQWDQIEIDGEIKPRRAGVSSFGVGGSNGHVILEEAPESQIHSLHQPGYFFITLSAKTEMALLRNREALLQWIHDKQKEEVFIEDIEWSLLVGREQFSNKLGIICDSIESLEKALQMEFQKDKIIVCTSNQCSYLPTKGVNQHHLINLLSKIKSCQDRSNEIYLEALKEISIFYMQKELDWDWNDIIRNHGKRVPLPVYSFDKKHYTIPYMNVGMWEILRPMNQVLHVNCSTFDRQCYRSIFDGRESFMGVMELSGKQVLSTAMWYEMARTALMQSTGMDGKEMVLSNVEVHMGLLESFSSLEVVTEVKKTDADKYLVEIIEDNSRQIICSCEYDRKKQTTDEITSFQCTGLDFTNTMSWLSNMEDKGLSYSSERLQADYVDMGNGLLCIQYDMEDEDSFINNVTIMDCMIQGVILSQKKNPDDIKLHSERISYQRELESKGYIYLKYEKLKPYPNIYIYNLDGIISVVVEGLQIEECSERHIDVEDKLFEFIWKPVDPVIRDYKQSAQILVVGPTSFYVGKLTNVFQNVLFEEIDDLSANMNSIMKAIQDRQIQNILWITSENDKNVVHPIIEMQNKGIYLLYEFIKQLVQIHYDAKALNITVLTKESQYVLKDDKVDAKDSGIWGLMGVVSKEFRRWNIRVFDLQVDCDVPVEALFGMEQSVLGEGFGYRNQRWYQKFLVESKEVVLKNSAYKQNGVYVVIGGAGGIGQIWTSYMIENYRAKVIWIGRRKKDETISQGIQNCTLDGIAPDYYSADATDRKQLENVYREIVEKYHNINGVIHSAIGSLDQSIANMSTEEYQNIVSVKVNVAVNLVEIFYKAELDFLVFFSSVASLQKLSGQSGYVTGCSFLDMYAHQLSREFSTKVKAINWGYWGQVGIGQMMPLSSVRKIEMSGMETIEPQNAMAAMEQILVSEQQEYLYTPVNPELFYETFKVEHAGNEKKDALIVSLRKMLSEVTSLPEQVMEPELSFEHYGLNEITATQLFAMIQKEHESISGELVHDLQTLDEIADYILSHEVEKTEQIEEKSIVQQKPAKQISDNVILERTIAYLKELVSKETGISCRRIDGAHQLELYGLDSIMIIHLTDVLKEKIKGFESTVFFEYTTIHDIAKFMVMKFHKDLQEMFCLESEKLEEKDVIQEDRFILQSSVSETMNPSINLASKVSYEEAEIPIAIIGMSGRFPMAHNLYEYWNNVKSGRDCITEIPSNRWSMDGFYTSDVNEAVENYLSYSKWGGMIDEFDTFDSMFFGISPKEAMNMDPQERLFLEESYKVLQDAGYTKNRLEQKTNGNVGVFVGVTRTGYEWYGSDLQRKGIKIRPNTSFSSIANRVSYFFNLNGPSLPIDTMCSSSLSALHVACENVKSRQCKMAIVGGVNIYTHPSTYQYLCQMHMLSKTGKCHTFGADADGFVPGEGVGAILIKPLTDAIADRDNIYAVIRGTNMNHGGKTNGFTVPSLSAQRELVAKTLEKASIDARMISYIEAHGTGTILGDPIEVSALTQAFHKTTQEKNFCAISSVKANIGHLEGAAGIAGVIKTVLQMQHKVFVPHINAEQLNPRINFSDSPFYVPKDLTEWKRPIIRINGESKEYSRIAGVSAFGAGGTNAHVILEEYDPELNRE